MTLPTSDQQETESILDELVSRCCRLASPVAVMSTAVGGATIWLGVVCVAFSGDRLRVRVKSSDGSLIHVFDSGGPSYYQNTHVIKMVVLPALRAHQVLDDLAEIR